MSPCWQFGFHDDLDGELGEIQGRSSQTK